MIFPKEWSTHKKLLFAMGLAGKEVEDTATGNPLTFITDLAKPLKSLVANFLPVQASGTPSPDNILPITGWDGLKVWNGGENVFDGVLEKGYIDAQGQNSSSNDNVRSKNYISVVPGTSYYVKFKTTQSSASNMKVFYYTADKTYKSNGWRQAGIMNVPSDVYFIRFYMDSAYTAGTDRDIAINYPSTETGYEAPHITETDIVFPSPVYGGTLDVVSGVLTVKWAGVDLGSKSWTKRSENTSRQIWEARFSDCKFENYQTSAYKANAMCSQFALTTSNGAWTPGNFAPALSGSNKVLIFSVPAESYASATECKEAMTGIIVAYELTTPQEIQLTPAQITALLGDNTIWSDANGSMTAVFLKKG